MTEEECNLDMHTLAAEALQSHSEDRPCSGDDGDICSAPLNVEPQVVELELLTAGWEEGDASKDREPTAEAEVSKRSAQDFNLTVHAEGLPPCQV